jgi:hypothetical protein
MAGTDASIHIKLGQIEIEYEGDASFLKKDLIETIKQLLELQEHHPVVLAKGGDADGGDAGGGGKFEHSTDTIANILEAKSGADLALAACAHLHFVKNKHKFTRHEIIAEMKTAPGHFKDTYPGNMSTYLNSLKGKKQDSLRLVGDHTYALSNKAKQVLEAKLAQA